MKIAILIDWFIYYTVELANALSQEHDVMLVTRDHNYEISSSVDPISIDEFLDAWLIKKINREKLKYRRRNLKNIFEVMRVYKSIRSFRPDIIHIQENTDWRILLIAKMLGFEKTVLFFGRISRYKGLDILIKAEPLITQQIPDAKIVIAGSGQDFGRYESLITNRSRFEIQNRFISHREVPKFFRRTAVVVLPYVEASQSAVVPIAYMFGKPVVVTNVGSIPEVVDEGKTGFVVPPNSPEDLSRAIIRILENHGLRKTMSANALAKASADLSWNTIAQETAKIYSLN